MLKAKFFKCFIVFLVKVFYPSASSADSKCFCSPEKWNQKNRDNSKYSVKS